MDTEHIVRLAETRGAEQAEAVISEEKIISIQFQGKRVKTKLERRKGFGVRLLDRNCLGFSYSTRFANMEYDKVVENALELAHMSNPCTEPVHLPAYGHQLRCTNGLDKRLASLDSEEIVQEIRKTVNCIDLQGQAEIVSGNIWISRRNFNIANSFGLTGERIGTCGSITFVTAARRENSSTGFAKRAFTRYRDFERALVDVPREAFDRVKENLNLCGTTLHEDKKSTVILEAYLSPYLLRESLIEKLRADRVKESYYYDKIGEQVASDTITIVDDGTLDCGFATSRFDDEGVLTGKKSLIEKGTLRGFLYDTVHACMDSTDLAGNGIRYSNIFDSKPIPGPTNVILKGEYEMSKEDLIESVEDGFIIRHAVGIETADAESSFLLPAIGAFRIRNGEKKERIRNLSFSSCVPDLLRNITGVGNDRVVQDYSDGREGLIFPSIRVDDVHIVAQ